MFLSCVQSHVVFHMPHKWRFKSPIISNWLGIILIALIEESNSPLWLISSTSLAIFPHRSLFHSHNTMLFPLSPLMSLWIFGWGTCWKFRISTYYKIFRLSTLMVRVYHLDRGFIETCYALTQGIEMSLTRIEETHVDALQCLLV